MLGKLLGLAGVVGAATYAGYKLKEYIDSETEQSYEEGYDTGYCDGACDYGDCADCCECDDCDGWDENYCDKEECETCEASFCDERVTPQNHDEEKSEPWPENIKNEETTDELVPKKKATAKAQKKAAKDESV